MANYQSFLILLDQWGARDVLIPFVLIFTIVFALLQKIKIFKIGGKGTDKDNANKKVNTILSLGISFAALTPHFTGRGFDVVVFINQFLPNSFLLLFVTLLFLALVGTVGGKTTSHESPLMGVIAIVAVFSLAVILLQSVQVINYPFLNFLSDPNTQAIVIVILVFVLLIWYIGKEPTSADRLTQLRKNPLLGIQEIAQKLLGKR